MLDHYTTPGESIEIRDNQTIYSLLTDRLARTGADTVIAAKKIGPGRWQNVTTGEFHERVVSAAKGLIALGIAKEDAKAPLVWFPNFLRHNMPESPNVVRSWVGAFRDLPESPLKGAMLERTGEAVRTLGEGFRSAFAEAFPGVLGRAVPGVSASRPGNLAGAPSEALPIPFGEAFPEGMPNQEQEQEQEEAVQQ